MALDSDLEKILLQNCKDNEELLFLTQGVHYIQEKTQKYFYTENGTWGGQCAKQNAQEIIQDMQYNYTKIKDAINPAPISPAGFCKILHIAENGLYLFATASYWAGNPLGGVPSSIAGALIGQIAETIESYHCQKTVEKIDRAQKSIACKAANYLGLNSTTPARAIIGLLSSISLPLGIGLWIKRKNAYTKKIKQTAWTNSLDESKLHPIYVQDKKND